jgi:hypothetical protein
MIMDELGLEKIENFDESIEFARRKVEQLKEGLHEHIIKIQERDVNLDHLRRSVDNLERNSGDFKLCTKKVKKIKQKKYLEKKKWAIVVICFLVFLVFIIFLTLVIFILKK